MTNTVVQKSTLLSLNPCLRLEIRTSRLMQACHISSQTTHW